MTHMTHISVRGPYGHLGVIWKSASCASCASCVTNASERAVGVIFTTIGHRLAQLGCLIGTLRDCARVLRESLREAARYQSARYLRDTPSRAGCAAPLLATPKPRGTKRDGPHAAPRAPNV